MQFKPYQASPLKETLQAYAAMDEDTLTAQKTTVANPMNYYHPEHLGTSTALTDINGEPYQFFLNLPFGETMAEQLGSHYYNSPYKFNSKELDEETGLYYYGARYYDPRVSNWLSVDPLAEKFPNASPYNYCLDNPINAIDTDGRRVFFVGGAGNDPISQGWNYMNRWKTAFANSNISGFTRLDVSRGINADAMFTNNYRNSGNEMYQGGVNTLNQIAGLAPAQEWKTRPVQNEVIDAAVSQIRNNLSVNPLAEREQLNLGGYSYGSVVLAQAALNLANSGTFVDNLILIGSPISSDSDLYKELSGNKNIGNIIRFDIKGDNLSNPSSFSQYLKGGADALIKGDAAPHFDLARPGSNIDKAIQGVTDWLKSKGVD